LQCILKKGGTRHASIKQHAVPCRGTGSEMQATHLGFKRID